MFQMGLTSLLEKSSGNKHCLILLQSLGFGGDGGALSALKSHSDDHSRIVALVDDILKTGSLSSSDVNKVVGAIHQHAERFDVLYATDDSKHTTKLGS